MLGRLASVTVAACACAACANDPVPSPLATANALQMHLLPAVDTPENAGIELKKTHASRVLSAIALERVTGRKPDPARLMELE